MGDLSAEPSMEDILSSIKRIIAEEVEPGQPVRGRRLRPASSPDAPLSDADEVLELSDPVPAPLPRAEAMRSADAPEPAAIATPEPVLAPEAVMAPADPAPEPTAPPAIVSDRATEASRGSLDALSRLVVRPETPGSDTLEGMVRDLLRPMLSEWLDANLPAIVDRMVAREIARISGREG